jgi:hypothetical protein
VQAPLRSVMGCEVADQGESDRGEYGAKDRPLPSRRGMALSSMRRGRWIGGMPSVRRRC